MKIVHTIPEARAACRVLGRGEGGLGFVPTMGALHAGHMALVGAAKARCGAVAVSIFVNPTQFGPNEDLAKYPRTMDADLALLEAAGVDLLFAPSAEAMYPAGSLGVAVDPGPLGDRLDGVSRPGHFRGVATVVTKLFGITEPARAFFGQKDAAQVAVLRAVVRDLDLGVALEVCPTVREPDGLALSSRNRYLSATERTQALALSQALIAAERAVLDEAAGAAAVKQAMRQTIERAGLRVDYADAVDAATLLPVEAPGAGTLLAVAAFAGSTRLIDNVVVGVVRA